MRFHLKELSTGVAFYLKVFKDTYPATDIYGYDGDSDGNAADLRWMNLVGTKGTWNSDAHGAQTDEADRLLNKYIDETESLAECPFDTGASFGQDAATAFAGYGSSYVYHNRTPN